MGPFALPAPATASYGLALVAFAAFAVHLALGARGGRKAQVLLAAVCASALWAGLNLAYAVAESPALWSAQFAADALRLGGWLVFAAVLLGGRLRWWALAIAAAAALTLMQGFLVMLSLAIVGLVLTEQLFRRARPQLRWALKPLCLGLGAGFVFDLYVYADALLFGRLDPDLWAARGFAHALAIPLVALATARNKEWTIDIALSRGVIFHSTAFLASGLYLLTVAGAGYYVRYFGGSWGASMQAGFIFAALLLLAWLFSSGSLRARLRVFINKHFYAYRYDYRQEWLRFTNLLATREPGVSSAQRSIEALANLVESPGGGLWLRADEGAFAQAARWNLAEVREGVAADEALARFLARTGWVVNLADYRTDPARYPGLALPQWLAELAPAWLVVPIIAQDELIGFVVLAAPRAPIDVNWEVLDLLKTAARQVGSFLAQLQASEALLEARKFEAFNRMGAFVVHDLKNLVAQLALLLKNAERHRHNPRFQDDMLATVRHVAERMQRLLAQLAAGNATDDAPRPVDLGAVAKRVAQARRTEHAEVSVESAGPALALGHEPRFERIIGHLVQNALDATRDGGRVQVKVCCEGAHALLEVRDSGCGMSEEFLRERLFRPFQTTKPAGMGIGAFETAQYVKEIGGSVAAESRPGAGTTIRIQLPLHREAAETRAAA